MNIRSRREIRQTAAQALASAPGDPRNMALVYGGITCLLSLLGTAVSFILNNQIADTGGLSNMGLRSILSTIDTLLPIVTTAVLLGLEIGYAGAMLDAFRGRTTGPRSLLNGFYRFGAMLRATIIQWLVYIAAVIAAAYVSSWIFLMMPASDAFYEIMEPFLNTGSILSSGFVMDEATLNAAYEALIPMMCIFAVLAIALILPISYQFRMATFCIADADHPRAMAAIRDSRQMMRRNRFALFRLDLCFWWYYLLQLLITAVCYGDMLLPLLGITLPWSGTVSYFLFLVLSLVLQLAVYYFFMNKVTITYAAAYESLRPEPPKNTVVLGNIFEM